MNLHCPWFDDEWDMGKPCHFTCKTAKQLHRHICDWPHAGIAMKLALLIENKLGEPSIPISKIEEKIAEFEDSDWCPHAVVRELRSLLPRQEETNPIPIGPTEADNWEYNGERWVKKK